MLQKTIYLLLLAFALLTPGGCKDDKEEQKKQEEIEVIKEQEEQEEQEEIDVTSEFQQPFLGQWKEIARGNEVHHALTPDGHIKEFLPDRTYHHFLNDGNVSTRRYRIDAEFLYLDSGTIPDGHTYRYSFTGTDTLRLDYVDGAITMSMATPTFNVYERLKNNEP